MDIQTSLLLPSVSPFIVSSILSTSYIKKKPSELLIVLAALLWYLHLPTGDKDKL